MDNAERERWIAAWFDGELPEADAAGLAAELDRDEEFRALVAKELVVRRNLAQGQVPEGDFSRQVVETIRRVEEPDALVDNVVTRLKFHRKRQRLATWGTAGLAAAALLVAGFLFMIRSNPSDTGIRVVAAESIGTLKLERLYGGERVRLKNGLMEIELTSKSRVVIEGPAAFAIPSPDFVKLTRGRCFAEMEKGESGLRIETPSGDVLDLGTKFAVDVRSPETMEVHVFDGEVEFTARGGRTRLEQGRAMVLDASGAQDIREARPERFISSVPRGAGSDATFVHWPFDDGKGRSVSAEGNLEPVTEASGTFMSGSGEGSVEPEWVDGVFGKAIEFSGTGEWVSTGHPGVAGHDDRTVACWIRLPAGEVESNETPLVSWGLKTMESGPGKSWMLAVGRKAKSKPEIYGRLRLCVGGQSIFGTTNLRDGRWHHVAAVTTQGASGPVALLYVDGQLENVIRDTLEFIETETDASESKPVHFGHQLFRYQRFMRGTLDEVYLFDAALSGDQVRALMRGEAFSEPE